MAYRIGKRFTFDAAHHLPSLGSGHKCSRPHGHTYTVEFRLISQTLTGPGFVTDFGDLDAARAYIDRELDHRDLNMVLDTEPTAEAIARHLAEWFQATVADRMPGSLQAVRVAETPSSWAEYRIEDSR